MVVDAACAGSALNTIVVDELDRRRESVFVASLGAQR